MSEIRKPKELNDWDFSDTITEPDGYYQKNIPDISRNNFNKLLDEYNNLVKVVNLLCKRNTIDLDI